MWGKTLILTMIVLLALTSNSYASKYEKRLAISCDRVSNFYIHYASKDQAQIAVNLGKVHVSTKVIRKNENTEEFIFIGGLRIKLKGERRFSRDKPILTLKKINEKKYLAYWHGFFDKGKQEYTLKDQAAIVNEGEKGPEKDSYYLYICEEYKKRLEASCEQYSNFYIQYISKYHAQVAVNSSQVYVFAKIIRKNKNTEEFIFTATAGLGPGGLRLNWRRFSKEEPILTLERINDKKYLVYWYGFYDTEKRKYTRRDNADIVREGEKGPQRYSYYLYVCEEVD